jgi:predicted AlkP superfamily phosphohydrolase/phosphomutase
MGEQKQEAAPLLIIGIDGLEWRTLLPLLREDRVPNLYRLMEKGSFG